MVDYACSNDIIKCKNHDYELQDVQDTRGQRCETWSLTNGLDYWTGLLDSICCQAVNRHQVNKNK